MLDATPPVLSATWLRAASETPPVFSERLHEQVPKIVGSEVGRTTRAVRPAPASSEVEFERSPQGRLRHVVACHSELPICGSSRRPRSLLHSRHASNARLGARASGRRNFISNRPSAAPGGTTLHLTVGPEKSPVENTSNEPRGIFDPHVRETVPLQLSFDLVPLRPRNRSDKDLLERLETARNPGDLFASVVRPTLPTWVEPHMGVIEYTSSPSCVCKKILRPHQRDASSLRCDRRRT